MPTSVLPSKMYWHRWFAWRPVVITDRAGRRQLVWLQKSKEDGPKASLAVWDRDGFIGGRGLPERRTEYSTAHAGQQLGR